MLVKYDKKSKRGFVLDSKMGKSNLIETVDLEYRNILERKAKAIFESKEYGLALDAWFDALEASSVGAQSILFGPYFDNRAKWRVSHETDFKSLLVQYQLEIKKIEQLNDSHDENDISDFSNKNLRQQKLSNLYNRLSYLYSRGFGIDAPDGDWKQAYQLSIEHGTNTFFGMVRIGYCYDVGKEVDKDEKKAVEWYQRAADQGYAHAQCNLGRCYEVGAGVDKDTKKAVEWYQRAALQGNAQAQHKIAWCYQHGVGIAKDEIKGFEWYQRAANQGIAGSQCNLGYCYQQGIGTAKNIQKAIEWYQKAASQGHERAQNNLTILLNQ